MFANQKKKKKHTSAPLPLLHTTKQENTEQTEEEKKTFDIFELIRKLIFI